jgi:hypothetical protein
MAADLTKLYLIALDAERKSKQTIAWHRWCLATFRTG